MPKIKSNQRKTIDEESSKEKRVTFSFNKDFLKKIELLAEAESYRLTLENKQITSIKPQDVVNSALEEYVVKYEKKHGELVP